MATERQTTHTPVSCMTLADLNRRNQSFHTRDAGSGSMMEKGSQLDPGDTVHNGRGIRGKVIRVQGGRVVVKLPDGGEDQWDLGRTYPAAESHDAISNSTGSGKLNSSEQQRMRDLDDRYRRNGQGDLSDKEMEELAHLKVRYNGTSDDSGATEELLEAAELNAEAMREFVAEENQEPAHQTEAV